MSQFSTIFAAGLLAFAAPVLAAAADTAPADNAEAEAPPPTDQQIAAGLFLSAARLTGPRKRDPSCGEQDAKGDIVVCGADRGERWRVPSTTNSDPTSRQATNTGIARAPNVSNLPDCSRGCLHLGKAPPKVMTLDLGKIPKAPAGSDADLIARGEKAER